MGKIQEAAKKAKADGYKYVSSIVRSKFNTVYHHVINIDMVIAFGWQGAPKHFNGWRIGQIHLPENCINKSEMVRKYA